MDKKLTVHELSVISSLFLSTDTCHSFSFYLSTYQKVFKELFSIVVYLCCYLFAHVRKSQLLRPGGRPCQAR